MKHLHLTLGYLREQRTQLDAAIDLLETFTKDESRGATNGHRAALSHAATALALHQAHSTGRVPPRQRAVQKMKPLPEVTVPAGLDLSNTPRIWDAIPLALKAWKKPADTKTLTAIILGAGFKYDKSGPLTTLVGTLCGRNKTRLGIKGTAAGWRVK